MNIGETVEIAILDENEDEIIVRYDYFDTMKDARRRFREMSKDRDFWVRCSESEDFPASIYTIQLIKNGEIIDDSFPHFKGSVEFEEKKREWLEKARAVFDSMGVEERETAEIDGIVSPHHKENCTFEQLAEDEQKRVATIIHALLKSVNKGVAQ